MVLIVDDDKRFLRTFVKRYDDFFSRFGLEIEEKQDAKETIKYLKREGKQVELIIVDIILPVPKVAMDLLSFAKDHFPSIKRIAITAKAERKDVGKIVARRLIDGYLEKDWKEQETKEEIKRVLQEPCEPIAHSRITEAIEGYLKQNPEAKEKKMQFLDLDKPITVAGLLDEIKMGTPFGRRQERLLYQLAWDLFKSGRKKGKS
jgi:response regulator RpfG family c-di-GMP phosphodiesterase